ncbi:energy transducer TonB [bacterium]|nr:energy transducer TonB [bacterium]MBU1676290.1 energy transducer TonB [bacterium]
MRSSGILRLCALSAFLFPAPLCLLDGCAARQSVPGRGSGDVVLREMVPPDGPWRPHELSRCVGADQAVPCRDALEVLSTAHALFLVGEGGDAVIELELYLSGQGRGEGLAWLTLGQLYVLAGQGEPSIEPREGPGAITGDWDVDRPRLLARAEKVLRVAASLRPDDSVVDFLLADAARARGDMPAAAALVEQGLGKCTLASSTAVLVRYQGLNPHPAAQTGGVEPEYPAAAARDGISGEVVLDLLVGPTGRVSQVSVASSPDRRLGEAAVSAMRQAEFAPGRLGKYPVWSWVRATVAFR